MQYVIGFLYSMILIISNLIHSLKIKNNKTGWKKYYDLKAQMVI